MRQKTGVQMVREMVDYMDEKGVGCPDGEYCNHGSIVCNQGNLYESCYTCTEKKRNKECSGPGSIRGCYLHMITGGCGFMAYDYCGLYGCNTVGQPESEHPCGHFADNCLSRPWNVFMLNFI